MKQRLAKIRQWEIPWPVVLITILVMVFLYISCSSGDLWVTGNSAWYLWKSNFFDYYDVVTEWQGKAICNYLPTTYILFGIWILPLKLLGLPAPETVGTVYLGYVWWYKALPVGLFGCSILLIYRICLMAGLGKEKAIWCSFAFSTAPVAMFSQFIFSQYDIFTVFATLLGIYYWMKKKDFPFILCFAVATTFKYYAAIFGLVLLLLREKRILPIILKTIGIAGLFILYVILFYQSKSFHDCIFGFFALDYVSTADHTTGLGSINYTQILAAVLVAWAYFTKPQNDNETFKWAVFLCCGVCFSFYGLSSFHPQWLLMGVPFWTIAMFMHRQSKVFPWLDMLFAGCYYLFTFIHWRAVADNVFIYHGIWQYVLEGRALLIHNADIIPFSNANLLYTLIVALLLICFVFNHPKYMLEDLKIDAADWKNQRWILYLRGIFGPVLYVIPTALCLIMTMMQPPLVSLFPGVASWEKVEKDDSISQVFTAKYSELSGIYLTFQEEPEDHTGGVTVNIIEKSTGKVLAEEYVTDNQIDGTSRIFISFDSIHLQVNHLYEVRITANTSSPSILGIGNIRADMNLGNYAIINGEKKTCNLCIDFQYK